MVNSHIMLLTAPTFISLLFSLFYLVVGHPGHTDPPSPTTPLPLIPVPKHKGGLVRDCFPICHGIICNEFNFTAWWKRAEFVGDEYEIKLIDQSCNNFHQNSTTLWITQDFGTCGATIVEKKDVIIQRNTAIFTVRNVTANIAREHVYKYNLLCRFARKNNASIGYKLVQGLKETVDLDAASEFDISIDVYTSTTFLITNSYPVTISINQPVYIGIRKVHSNKHFKMIVEHCFATPTAHEATSSSYVFFLNKCPTDPTFRVIDTNDKDLFSFVITAFRFIKLSKSIYVHCRAIMCQTDSTSQQCQQSCTQPRIRRTTGKRSIPNFGSRVFENSEVEEIQNITSSRILLVQKRTCGDMICPAESRCIELYPAVCRCNDEHVYSNIQGRCLKDRILSITGIHSNSRWVRTFGDDSSEDFFRFANELELSLKDLFQKIPVRHIEGTKVVKARKGRGVVVDIQVMYKKQSTPEDVFNTLIKPFTSNNFSFTKTLRMSNINSDSVPKIFQGTYATIHEEDVTKPKPRITPAKIKPTLSRKIHVDQEEKEGTLKPLVTQSKKRSGVEGPGDKRDLKENTLIWVLIAISFVVVFLIGALICHYKRNIYYHVMTW